jgi:molybdate transport system permease protein
MLSEDERRRIGRGEWWIRAYAVFAVALFLLLLVMPAVGLLSRSSVVDLARRVTSPVVLEALWLSLFTSICATVLVVGAALPLAYLLAYRKMPAQRFVEVLVDLPMVLPPTVAGLGLLLAFGRNGLVGQLLRPLGLSIPFSTPAVILAQMFVAGPFFINAARAGFEAVDRKYANAAATLRASPVHAFVHVILPLSMPSLIAGAAMAWARALGEFGATITFAGNLPGVTQTMPLAVYIAMQTDLEAAMALAVILLLVSVLLLLVLRGLPRVYRG